MESGFNQKSPPTIPLNTKSWQKRDVFSTSQHACADKYLLRHLPLSLSHSASSVGNRSLHSSRDTPRHKSLVEGLHSAGWYQIWGQQLCCFYPPFLAKTRHHHLRHIPRHVGNDMKCDRNNWNWVAILKAKLESENGEILADWGLSCCGIQTIPLRKPKTSTFVLQRPIPQESFITLQQLQQCQAQYQVEVERSTSIEREMQK